MQYNIIFETVIWQFPHVAKSKNSFHPLQSCSPNSVTVELRDTLGSLKAVVTKQQK